MNYLQTNCKLLREFSGLNQAQLSLSLGFSRGAWNNYEKGKSKPSLDDFIKISKYFGYSASDLLERDLSNVLLNEKRDKKKSSKNVLPIVLPSVLLNEKKAQKEPCKECEVKDIIIEANKQLLQSKIEQLEQQQTIIKLLQNQIDQMKYDIEEREKTQYTQRKERKTA